MDFFTIIGYLFVLIYIFFITFLVFTDCDLRLFWCQYFGQKLDVLKDKVIWITGASTGIGEYLAVEVAKNGAKVILSARTLVNLERVKKRCIEESGAKAENISILQFDVTEESKHSDIFEKAVSTFGKIDILVNNAGRSQRAKWEDVQTDVDRDMFNLNLFPVLSLSRIAIKYFEKENIDGHLVVTSSGAGLLPVPCSCSYTGSKHAIQGYFNSLRLEKFGSNLSVTVLCPGPVYSNLLPNCFTAVPGEKFGQQPLSNERKMSTERCAYLSSLAIANRLEEAWMGIYPIIPLMYTCMYYPVIGKWIFKTIGVKGFMKLRDSNQIVMKEE